MKKIQRGLPILFLVSTLLTCRSPSGPSIRIENAWARPAMAVADSAQTSGEAMGMAGTGALFMQLVNNGTEPDRLIGGKTDAARVVEIHETVMEGDVMKMQMLASGLVIPAQGKVVLEPGRYHIMLIGLQRDLKVGDEVRIELQFEKSGTVTVQAQVQEP